MAMSGTVETYGGCRGEQQMYRPEVLPRIDADTVISFNNNGIGGVQICQP